MSLKAWYQGEREQAQAAAVLNGPARAITVTPPAPAPMPADNLSQEHIETAKRLGAVNAAIKREMVLAELAVMGLGVYPYDRVTAYLDQQFPTPSTSQFFGAWCWKPLREYDQKSGLTMRNRDWRSAGIDNSYIYQGPVPLPVLLTVERLASVVPGICFYISDKSEPRPAMGDPFLMVAAAGMDGLVIERWDEPNFTVVAGR